MSAVILLSSLLFSCDEQASSSFQASCEASCEYRRLLRDSSVDGDGNPYYYDMYESNKTCEEAPSVDDNTRECWKFMTEDIWTGNLNAETPFLEVPCYCLVEDYDSRVESICSLWLQKEYILEEVCVAGTHGYHY